MNLQNIEAIYPLSPFQASLLSGDLRALDPSVYCGQVFCSLHGQLDSEAFERAWRLIINEYPILRTTFAWENLEKPVQLVHRQIEFSLLQHDWSGLSPEQQQELLDTLLETERETGFHPTQAPLMRLCLCRLSDNDYYLLWSYDLLVLDNWSLPLLLEKAIAVYEGQLKGEIPQVEQGRLYQDYIAWLKQQDITQAEAFWKESLNGLKGSENLNGLFRSTYETANGYAHIQLPSGLTASLRALASEHQLDFQALVQGAWALLLSRYSGENEIVYGATVSGRPADLTGASLMIGPFSNVLPVHVRVSSSTPVVSWLKSLSAHLDDLRKYSFYPVRRWSNNDAGVSDLPTFASTVQIESSPTNGILHDNGASLHVRHIRTVEKTKSPLTLIAPSHSEATLQLSYNPATLDDATAGRLTQHFENLVTGIVQQPQVSISHLSILSPAELEQLLYSFNDTAVPLVHTSIHASFQQQALRAPVATALSFLDSSLTYGELDRRSNQLAHHLLSLGVSPDSLVAVCLDRSLELFIALLGILKAGAAYLPLDPSYPPARLSFMLAHAGSPLLLTTDALANELPTQWTPRVLLDADWDVIALNTDAPLPETVVAADQLAYVMYTPGSTGTAKGVAVTHGGVVRLVTSPNYVRLDAEQTLLQMAPLTFDASTFEVWGALMNGARLVVMPPNAPTPDEISRVIVAEGVTTLWLTAGLFHLMVDEQLEGLSEVEQLLTGGEVLSVRHVEKYLAAAGNGDRRLVNGYGPTENTTFTCCHVMDGNTRLSGSVPIGRPITNTQIYVLDAEMQVVPVGVKGELYIGGAGLARGYFKQPELTAERFVPHPHSTETGERLYRTGDRVRWHESGELEFIGRVDGQVKIRGFSIEVGEIEAVPAGHAGIREAERLPLSFAQQRSPSLDQQEPGRSSYNIPAAVRSLFEQPMVAGLASEIEAEAGRGPGAGLQAPPLERVERGERLPLSFAQQRLWFLDQLEPGSSFYNVPSAVRLRGVLNIEALERTLSEVVRRHEVLRTHFIAIDGKPVQVIEAPAPFRLEVLDLSVLDEAERTAETRRLVATESARPFDLTTGPLLRVSLLRLGAEEHVALVTMHHIVSDGWSIGVLIREVAALYAAYVRGEESPLEELPIQYADFAHWQRRWLQGEVLEAQLDYWRAELAEAPTVIDLPIDKPRPPVQTYRGDYYPLQLSAELSEQLRDLSRRHGSTLFMTLLAAFDLLLCRYARQEQVLVGTPIANRNRSDTEALIGFFVNTLVLRGDVRGNPSFRELLRRVRDAALGAYAHQDLPFEKLVEELKPGRELSRSPLFQVMFILQNAPRDALELGGLRLSAVESAGETAKFELTLALEESGGVIVGGIEYNSDLYEAESIGRLAASYQRVLRAVVTDAEQRVFGIELLSEAERRQLIEEWNETAAAFPPVSVSELFEAQAARTPEAVALLFENTALSYRELNERANQLARYLQRAGVGSEMLVGILMNRSVEMVVALLGILKAGVAYVPLDPSYPLERLAFMVQDSSMRLLLTQRELIAKAAELEAGTIVLDEEWEQISAQSVANPPLVTTPDNLIYVIYTSGSTGKPKGVQISHRAVVNFLTAMSRQPGLNHDDVLLAVTTLSFDIAGLELYLPLITGARLVLASREETLDGALLLKKLLQSGATAMQATPVTWRLLIAAGWEGAAPFKVLCGGEALPSDLAQELTNRSEEVWNLYGPTETTIWSTVQRLDHERDVTIGRPIANTQIYLLDDYLQAVPLGVPGQLYIGGAGLAIGYLNQPALTAERFVPNPYGTDGARLYQTGDLAWYRLNGEIEYLGRLDQQVKIRGFRIELGEIEAVLSAHESLREAIVVARETASGDQQLVAYVVRNSEKRIGAGESADDDELRSEQIEQWENVWDETYGQTAEHADYTFNIVGWNSSYTGLPIPAAEMQSWVDETVNRVLALSPQKVLEIGCGTGLLLFRIAPHTSHYYGTDVSQRALSYIEQNLGDQRPGSIILSRRPAEDFAGLESGAFDTVILNSVVQYFPDLDYLLAVLTAAVKTVKQGSVFLGDIRNLRLLEAFHASVVLANAPPTMTAADCRRLVQERSYREEELFIDPDFFYALKQQLPEISSVEIQLKRGAYQNELTRFRYDVVLHISRQVSEYSNEQQLDWQTDELSVASLQRLLKQTAPASLRVSRVPNLRVARELQAAKLLADSDPALTVAEIREALAVTGAVDPEDIWALGELPYRVAITWSERETVGAFDVVFTRAGAAEVETSSGPIVSGKSLREFANDPLQGKFARKLVPTLRAHLKENLPDYMVPATFVLLDKLPLTPNGKIDRRALQARQVQFEAGASMPARTPAEEIVAAIWAEVLGRDVVGVYDNFFELGGHSLLATQVISRVRDAFRQEVALRSLFEQPTVAGLVQSIEQQQRAGAGLLAPPLVRITEAERLPLSFAQQRLWFLDQLEPGSSSYNMPAAVRLKGRLDVDALQRTLDEVVRRHEVLRTTFVAVNGEALQVIAPASQVELPVIDLSELPEEQREAEASELAAAEAQQPFELSAGPLLRVQLLRLSAEDHVVLFTMHHIITDGWSTGILVREVAALYAAYIEGRESPLAELEIQYADYAVWQREWLQGEVLEQQLTYWRQQLGEELPVLQLPTDKPRPPVQSYRGRSLYFSLPAKLTAELKKLSNAEAVTLYMTLLAAFKILLWRYSGQSDVVVGTPIAGRNHLATEGLIGLFVNTLVLRTSLSGDPSFRELLYRIREVTLGAYAHQDLPFEKLVEELQPERDLSRSPLFQVMFLLQNATAETLRLPGLELIDAGAADETAKFDLTLGLAELDNELSGSLQYNVDLFEAATIERLVQHYELLLEAVVADPDRQLSQLPLLLQEDEHKLLVEWNDTHVSYDLEKCVHQFFKAQASRMPHAVAVVAGTVRLSYADLDSRAEKLAGRLRREGVGPEQCVGVLVGRGAAMVVSPLGVLMAGGAYVPLDAAYPSERLSLMADDAQLSVLVAEEGLNTEFVRPGVKLVRLDKATGECIDDASEWDSKVELPAVNVTPENLAYVIYTSGSTGRPKGVAITHRSAVAFMHWARDVFPPAVLRGVLASTSLSFDLSVFELFVTLSSGGKIILADNALHLPTIEAAREVTLINTVPSAMAELLRIGGVPDSVQTINLAGEALAPSLVQQIYEQTRTRQVWNLYGPSEDTTYSTSVLIEKNQSGPMVVGRPIANTQAYICDEMLRPLPVGVAGELMLAGDGLARGYIRRPALTAERFLPNPFSSAGGARLYRTGDLARYRADGQIEFLGRADSQLKLRGFRIEPGEIETRLREHPAVREVIVTTTEVAPDDKRLVAYVVTAQSGASVNDVRDYLRGRLPEYMVPSAFVLMDAFPLTASGKIDRRALPSPDGAGADDYQAPRTQTEELLYGLWTSVLRVSRVGVHDNFFQLGGHSLLATQLVSRVRESFGVELPLRELFARPTVAGLAEQVEAALRGSVRVMAPPMVAVSREQQLPLSHAQERLWFLDQLGPGSVAYNIPAAVRLKGRLDVDALQRTLDEVVRRHEALRTTFVAVNGEPVQVIAPASQVALPVIDLSELPEEQREAEASELAAAEAQQPFELSAGPLLRVQLLRLSAEDHVVLFTMHHIITDGWSTGILVREVAALYAAYIEGRESPLAELEIQYADYAVWQREWLQGEVLEQQLTYWRQQLGEELPVLQLPTDKPRPPVQSYRGRSLYFSLPAPLTAELKKLSNAEGVTLYMTLLAAFKILLWRYSGQSDVVVGTPIAGRNYLATEGLIGLFVNTLVLRTTLSGDPSFSVLLDRVKDVTLGAYAHQDLPFEKLVEELQPERDMSRSPLFQVVFALHNETTETLRLPGLEANEVGSAADETVKFDITMGLTEIHGELSGSLQYSTDLFEASTIRRMLMQFERLLASAVSAPEQHISQLELLSSAERQQLLVERNDTQVAYPHSRAIHELFEEQVELAADKPALTFDGQHVSYAELNSRANQLAHYLRQLGVQADTPVGVCLHRSVEMVVALLAILKAGGTYVPLDPEYPAERLAFIVEDVFPPVILTDSSLVDDMPSSWAQTLCLDTESELWSALPTSDLADLVSSSDNLAYVMYTSGSTGNPKGVAVPHRAVVRLVRQSAYVDFGHSEVFLQLAPVTFDASTLEIWGALLNGGRLVLMPPGAPNLSELGKVLRSEGVTVLWLTAGLFHLMVEQELEALASVTQVVAGGDVLSAEHVRRLLRAKEGRGVVVNGYGPTETTTFACCHRMSSEKELEHGVPIGRPIGNTQVYVLSEEMELAGDGMLGELYIGGDGLARGYYNRPGLSADRFVPHPFTTIGGERLYRTGDYVSWRADGTLEFIGRRDTQVKIRGFRVEPGEVEAVLGQHGAVKECAVVVRRETNGEKRLVAYVVDGNHEDGVNASELRDYLREQLPEFMLPAAIVAIESLPLTPNGKVDRRELAAREVRVGGDQSYVPPRTINEELLCNIWEEVLHVERVGIEDNFFDLGGDSILTIKVIVMTRAVGLELNVQQLFQYQTVHELAQELERANESPIIVEETAPFSLIGEEDRLRLPAGVVDAYPVTALQAGMLFHTELAPEAGQYHDIFSYHLRMPFDEEALQAALRQLLESHPVLRTSFNLTDFNEPLQLVHEQVEVPLLIEDTRSLTPAEQEEYVAEWIAAEKRHHFDWRKAPLLRFQIDRRDEESFQFSFSFHHAILDGWSLATMLTELFNLYASVLKGDERRTNVPLSSSFRDFVAAEQAVLNSAEARQYWTTMLSEAPHSRLPRLGQSAGPSQVAGHRVDISGELSLALKALARTAGVPLKSVLLAAHLRALSVLTGSNDVLTGMVSHGRPETADSERVLGLFLNTLPFRRRLAGGTWLQLVQETFAAERELLPFRRYPMARMQQDLGNDTPLFEITFNFTHFHAFEEMQHVGLEVLGTDGVADTNFTLAVDFSLELASSQIELNLHYDTAELSAEQIESLGRIYLTILESMTRQPLERYEHQSLLSPAERQRILNDWNDTRVAYDSEKWLQQLFEAQ